MPPKPRSSKKNRRQDNAGARELEDREAIELQKRCITEAPAHGVGHF